MLKEVCPALQREARVLEADDVDVSRVLGKVMYLPLDVEAGEGSPSLLSLGGP